VTETWLWEGTDPWVYVQRVSCSRDHVFLLVHVPDAILKSLHSQVTQAAGGFRLAIKVLEEQIAHHRKQAEAHLREAEGREEKLRELRHAAEVIKPLFKIFRSENI